MNIEPPRYPPVKHASPRNEKVANRRYCNHYLWSETFTKRKSRQGREQEEIAMFMIGFERGYADTIAKTGAPNRPTLTANWCSFLAESQGCIILSGEPYPNTKPTILLEAKAFFRDGYSYGIEWAQKEASLKKENPQPNE